MLIIATGRKNLKPHKVPGYKCEHCGAYDTTYIVVQAKYIHLFWIPMLPIGKTGCYMCDSCDYFYDGRKFPERLKFHLENFKVKNTIPLQLYIGPAVLVLVVIYSFFASGNASKERTEFLKNPKVGDVYFYDQAPSVFSTMKIGKVTADSVFVYQNNQTATKVMKAYGLNQPENYEKKLSGYSRAAILKMYKDELIFTIDRD